MSEQSPFQWQWGRQAAGTLDIVDGPPLHTIVISLIHSRSDDRIWLDFHLSPETPYRGATKIKALINIMGREDDSGQNFNLEGFVKTPGDESRWVKFTVFYSLVKRTGTITILAS